MGNSNGGAARAAPKTRIVVVGGGFGGAQLVRHLEGLCRRSRHDVQIILVSKDNYFLMTPLLFEACSGTLQLQHCSVPIRAFLHKALFLEATVRHIDLERRVVHASGSDRAEYEVPYDQLVLAPGSVTNTTRIPGSEYAFTFKALADALVLRNHILERFERAEVETDQAHKRKLLTFVVVGGGLVGIELLGELNAFVDSIGLFYPHVRRDDVRFVVFEGGEHILPEIEPQLVQYAEKVLRRRPGVEIRTGVRVTAIEPEAVHVGGETLEAGTIVLSAGILPSPLVATLPLEKGRHGELIVDATMRCPSRPEVWALGDCASIPSPNGKPYPTLAQHALREAKALAGSLHAVLHGGSPRPFVYHIKGLMGSLGHKKAFAQVLGVRLRGFLAWWVRRTYYLAQVPGWTRRLHVVMDWTMALFFRPDIVKIDTAREAELLLRDAAAGGLPGPVNPLRRLGEPFSGAAPQ
jgi:NADH dehydrogenase